MTQLLHATILVGLLVLLALVSSFQPAESPRTDGKYNVILISIDSLRADRMGVYGYERATTPAIDAWAKDALVFDNYFSTSFLTPVSEVSVHTGEYPFRNGVMNFSTELRQESKTLAQLLSASGWQTVSFSSSPEFAIHGTLDRAMRRGFDVYEPALAEGEFRGRGINVPERALTWLQQERSNEQPFFLWVAVGTVHWPYGMNAPKHFTDRFYTGFLNDTNAGWETYRTMYNGVRYQIAQDGTTTPIGSYTAEDLAYVNDRYDDGVRATDKAVDRLLAYLKRTGLDQSTIVIVQSEHGESLGERGYIAHTDIYDEQMHVPLIISAPHIDAGRITALASGVDVLPTLMHLLNLPSADTDGINLLTETREEVFLARVPLWESVTYDEHLSGLYDTGIRNERWKLIHRLSRAQMSTGNWWSQLTGAPVQIEEYELYDLSVDPAETTNVYAQHKSLPEVRRLQEKLFSWEQEMEQVIPNAPSPSPIQPYF